MKFYKKVEERHKEVNLGKDGTKTSG